MTAEERLLTYREIDANGCWLWTLSRYPSGYGQTSYFERGIANLAVHRLAAHLWLNFDLNPERFVLHHCDVRRCFNPAHLFVGTKADNTADMMRKGRHRYKTHRKDAERAAAMRLIAAGLTQRETARRVGVSHSAVQDWVRQA